MPADGSSSSVLFRALPERIHLAGAERGSLQQFARLLADQVVCGRSFTCLVTDDTELLRLNREFLGRDYPADVLSFPAPESSEQLGELAISIERAQAQADEYEHSLLDEVRILMLHGVLHLAGFDHEQDQGEMALAEEEWRRIFGLPTALIARAGAAR
jgi:probable rRNA maturation factor